MDYTDEEVKMLEEAVDPETGIIKMVLRNMRISNYCYDDCFSAAQMKLCFAVKRFDPARGKWRAYAWKTAENAAMQELKKIKAKTGKNLPLFENRLDEEYLSEMSSDLKIDLENNLSDKEKETIQRLVIDGASYRQFAEKTNISPSDARGTLTAALTKLRNMYE